MIGQTLGHYRVLEKIGAGGMGEVYRARDERLERDVALKVLPAGTLADEAARQRFRREALALGKLNHPNIQSVFDFDTQDGIDFLVTEYVPGVTLSDRLAGKGLAEKEVLRLGQQLAEGLAAAHEQGIIHRDLKPGNLRVTPDARLKILDFGVAKLLGPVSETAATETGTRTVAGTPLYMSPEQRRGERVDARSDLYSAGLVLWETATGKPPVAGRGLSGGVSPDWRRIVEKCLEEDPENRYQSAKELAVDLRRLATSITPSPQAPAWGTMGTLLRSAQRPLPLGVGLALVVVALLALNIGGLRERLFGEGAPKIDSLAVLPLKNLMGDPEQDYFVEGMHEALTAELSKISALKVISRTSAMRYKDTDKPMPQIAQELGVDALVEGSVLREGNQVRITVQLIHGPTDRHLWAQSFDRELRGILALHSDVARAIANEIRVKLTSQEHILLASTRPVNPEAYEAYLKGRLHVEKMSPEALDTALEYFQLALEKDSNYARAYVGIGFVWGTRAHTELLPPDEGYAKARAAAVKAVELDDTLSDAHELLAVVRTWHDWDWAAGEREFRRAIELNPNYAGVRSFYSLFLIAMRRPHEAKAQIERALELDPYNSFFHYVLGAHLAFERRYDEALAPLRKAAAMQPDGIWPHWGLSIVFHQKRMHKEALAEAKEYFALRGDREVAEALERGYAEGGYARAMKLAAETLAARSQRTYVSPIYTAFLYARAGEKDRAFEWLEQAYRTRSGQLAYANLAPDWNPLRDDPRFQDLLRRMNFPE